MLEVRSRLPLPPQRAPGLDVAHGPTAPRGRFHAGASDEEKLGRHAISSRRKSAAQIIVERLHGLLRPRSRELDEDESLGARGSARQRLAAGLYEKSRLTAEERARTLFEWSYPEMAERCRQLGRPYPPLTADGKLASNPMIDISTVST